jgi:hypothetical protein
VCKTTIVSILALTSFINEGSAKLGLVLVGVIEFLHSVVGFFAFFTFGALSIFKDVLALLRLIRS